MPPMEPIAETVEAVADLDRSRDSGDLMAELKGLADRAQTIVPDLVGVSVGLIDEGLTFTLVASEEEIAVLDAVQYLAAGPCVDSAATRREYDSGDVLSEKSWQAFAQLTAARTVRSTLSLPVMSADAVVGTVHLYAAATGAFQGHHERLAEVFGAWAAGAVTNADLPFQTIQDAKEAPGRVRQRDVIDIAVGILAVQMNLDLNTAEERLREAAARAGVSVVQLAEHVLLTQEQRDGDES